MSQLFGLVRRLGFLMTSRRFGLFAGSVRGVAFDFGAVGSRCWLTPARWRSQVVADFPRPGFQAPQCVLHEREASRAHSRPSVGLRVGDRANPPAPARACALTSHAPAPSSRTTAPELHFHTRTCAKRSRAALSSFVAACAVSAKARCQMASTVSVISEDRRDRAAGAPADGRLSPGRTALNISQSWPGSRARPSRGRLRRRGGGRWPGYPTQRLRHPVRRRWRLAHGLRCRLHCSPCKNIVSIVMSHLCRTRRSIRVIIRQI